MIARPDTSDLSWLLAQFADDAGVAHAIAVSSDGLLLAASGDLPEDRAEQLAAIAAGTASLAEGGARLLNGGRVVQTVIEMSVGLLFLMTIGDGSCLAVLAPRGCDVGKIGYEMTLLVDRVGAVLVPETRQTSG
ncbi:roadblock/LC7 domain-containing protein [Actinocatenispora rupis]|uniref:Dynein regulation protein LC7 n=1 Tax=Actinocatenispora rupis TaxID=519421 RepID=A0A8J3NBF3_9ACTN|nr:roadblock/LC7 domain-containing protein [Actinocatenispora rupis]GID10730.1 dynein regulation protein LC7 [Actinocatenispora rupis]